MTVMNVWIVRVGVREWFVGMLMCMRFRAVPRKGMAVPMVLIVLVAVRVSERLVGMVVFMPFGEVQPHARCHQTRCDPEGEGPRFVEEGYRNSGAYEGGCREVSARS